MKSIFRNSAWLSFFGFWFLYMITSSGGFSSGDALTRYEVAKSLVKNHEFAIDGSNNTNEPLNNIIQGRNGKLHSTYGLTQTFLMVPVIAATEVLPFAESAKDNLARLVFNLFVIPCIASLTLVILFNALKNLGFDSRESFLSILTLALATPYWHYARTADEENILSFSYCLWLLGVSRHFVGKPFGFLIATVGICVAVATRWACVPSVLVLEIITLTVFWKSFKTLRKEVLISFLLGATVALGMLAFNFHRFGSPWQTGYSLVFAQTGLTMFEPSQTPGRILALLFSPYKGLLLYSPALLLAMRGVLSAKKTDKTSIVQWGGLLAFCAAFVLNSFYTYWTGGYGWGPRLLVAPLVFSAPFFAAFFRRSPTPVWAKFILALSFGIQLMSVCLPPSTEEVIRAQAHVEHLSVAEAWRTDFSPLLLRLPLTLRAMKNTWNGEAPEASTPANYSEVNNLEFHVLYFWPYRIFFKTGWYSLGVATALMLAFGIASAYCLLQARNTLPLNKRASYHP